MRSFVPLITFNAFSVLCFEQAVTLNHGVAFPPIGGPLQTFSTFRRANSVMQRARSLNPCAAAQARTERENAFHFVGGQILRQSFAVDCGDREGSVRVAYLSA